MAEERLQKIIAAAGIASRRKAEELITQGRVTVNGQVVTELGTKADLSRDHIKVDGKLLQGPERHIYLLLHKPKGYVTSVSDPQGRPTVMDLVKTVGERIYPLGRLDYNSEGLLLLSNDGELANYLTQAASHVAKVYLVKVAGNPAERDIADLRHGIRIGNKPGLRGMHAVRTAPAEIKLVKPGENPWYEVTLFEGKNRQIRRMFEEVGHHVEKIKRIRYGPLSLDVEPGQFRELTASEVAALRRPGQRHAEQASRKAAKESVRYLGKARPTGRQARPGKRPFRVEERGEGRESRPLEAREQPSEAPAFRREWKREDRRHTQKAGFAAERPRRERFEDGHRRGRDFKSKRVGGRPGTRGDHRFSQSRASHGERPGRSEGQKFERGEGKSRPAAGRSNRRPGREQGGLGFGGERDRFGRPERGRFGRAKSKGTGATERKEHGRAGGRSRQSESDQRRRGSRPQRPRKP